MPTRVTLVHTIYMALPLESRPQIPDGFQSPVTILFITGRSDWGLAPRQVFEIMQIIKPLGFRVIVAAPNEAPYGMEFRKQADGFVGIPKGVLTFEDLNRLRRAARSQRVNVIHSHGQIGGLYSRLLTLITGIGTVHSFHGRATPTNWRGQIHRALEFLLSNVKFTSVFATASEIATSRTAGLIQATTPTVVLEKAINLKSFPKRKQAALSGAKVRIGSVLRGGPAHGPDLFLKLATDCAELGEWSCAGLGADYLQTVGAIPPSLEVVGQQLEPTAWLQSIDIYIATTRNDGNSGGVLEAMASGCLCVLSDTPAHRDFERAQAALLFNPEKRESLESAILHLRQDVALRSSLLSNSRYYLERYHNGDKFKDGLIELYRTTVRGY